MLAWLNFDKSLVMCEFASVSLFLVGIMPSSRGGSASERLMSTLAYGWVECCSDVASCGSASFKISILVLNLCKLLVLWIKRNMMNVLNECFCFRCRMHYASVYIFIFNAFYLLFFNVLVVSSPLSVWGVGTWQCGIRPHVAALGLHGPWRVVDGGKITLCGQQKK